MPALPGCCGVVLLFGLTNSHVSRSNRSTPKVPVMNGRLSCSGWLCALLLVFAVTMRGVAAPVAPKILGVRTSKTNLLVTVQVPKGWQTIVLESRARLDGGSWLPRAVAQSAKSSKVIFRIPGPLGGQSLRVRGESTVALPARFYKGKHAFTRHRSTFWRPDQGRGRGVTPAGGGDLPANANSAGTAGTLAPATPARAVVESDLWRISGDTLYFFNRLRGLQGIDISNPDAPMV